MAKPLYDPSVHAKQTLRTRIDLRAEQSLPPPREESVEGSIPPRSTIDDHEARIGMLETTVHALGAQVRGHDNAIDGIAVGVEAQIKASIGTAIAPLKIHLDRQDVESNALHSNVSELLDLARKQSRQTQKEALDAIRLSTAEKKVFSGANRERRLWLKALSGLILVLVALGSAAGVSQCRAAHAVEVPVHLDSKG